MNLGEALLYYCPVMRGQYGKLSAQRQLTAEQARTVRKYRHHGESKAAIAKFLNVQESWLRNIA